MAQRKALLIGNYSYEDTNITQLKAPATDISSLEEVLRDPQIGQFDEVISLRNPSDREARRNILSLFQNSTSGDLLFLYFSGHGILDINGRLYLAVRDTEKELLEATSVPASFITERMDKSLSKRQLLVLDCCNSGAFARGSKNASDSVNTGITFEGNGLGRVVLTASDALEYAWEGETLLQGTNKSLFTHFLVEGLRSGVADSNMDGVITVDELYNYIFEKIMSLAPMQKPGKWAYKEQGKLALAVNVRGVQRRQQIEALYTKARENFEAGNAQEVLDLLKDIEELDTSFPDPYGIGNAARLILEEAEATNRRARMLEEAKRALASGLPSVRRGAVDELANLLNDPDTKTYNRVINMLKELQNDDSRTVSQAAINVLANIEEKNLSAQTSTSTQQIQISEYDDQEDRQNKQRHSTRTGSTIEQHNAKRLDFFQSLPHWFWYSTAFLGLALIYIIVYSDSGKILGSLNNLSATQPNPTRETPFSQLATEEQPFAPQQVKIPDEYDIPMRLVPEGEFKTNDGTLITLGAFLIDEFEVTNENYTLCVSAGACDPPKEISSLTHSQYYGNPDFANYPVINVTWDNATQYCQWREARLPSELEWEKAAAGIDGRIYPWGDEETTCLLANVDLCKKDTTEVGIYDLGVSPYGLYDMIGNVAEWVDDYGYSPTVLVIKGGHWGDDYQPINFKADVDIWYQGEFIPGVFTNALGFRCAKSYPDASIIATPKIP